MRRLKYHVASQVAASHPYDSFRVLQPGIAEWKDLEIDDIYWFCCQLTVPIPGTFLKVW